jgi:hypothetical protein
MTPGRLKTMERWNLLFGAAFTILAAIFFPADVALGVALGAVLCAVNFWSIRRVWERLLTGNIAQRQSMQVAFLVKTVLLIAVVFVVVRFLPVHPAGFAVGFSIFLLSIAVESVRFALSGHAVHKP